MTKRWADREIKGSGRFGVAYGGLSGDGDVKLVATPTAARDLAMAAFRELIGPGGTLVRSAFVEQPDADALMDEAQAQLSGWSDAVDGAALDVEVHVESFHLRVGVFKCWWGPKPSYARERRVGPENNWWIPAQVRISADLSRLVEVPEPVSKGRKR